MQVAREFRLTGQQGPAASDAWGRPPAGPAGPFWFIGSTVSVFAHGRAVPVASTARTAPVVLLTHMVTTPL